MLLQTSGGAEVKETSISLGAYETINVVCFRILKMAQQVVLITGCSTGMGLDFAVTMARNEKYIVYASMRNLAKKSELEKQAGDSLNKTLFIKQLDVTKEDEIISVVADIHAERQRIDILVNNAGFGQFNACEKVPIEKVRKIFEGNVIGPTRLCQEVISGMKERKSGRIIFVGAGMGLVGYPFNEYYSAAKFAMEGFAEAFAPIGRHFNIWVSTLVPGPVKTTFIENVKMNDLGAFAESIDADADEETKKLAGNMSGKMQKVIGSESQSPEDITRLLLEVAATEKPHLRYATSEAMKKLMSGKYVDVTGDGVVDRMCHILS
ncbi:retinol dehydrogenase 8-like isoform X2 [Apostichopus japonicus]|uniref:retinol dehydrogenase 8-like isoform X2 n=1 Tax=Stichopus japonicus TaxID=307972 RepID=UPI003AB602AE